MTYSKYIGIIIIAALFSCGASKTRVTYADIEALEALVKGRQFTIESDWAYPQTTGALQQILSSGLLQGASAGSINLIGNTNFLTISGDSISAYLPYFGERQMQVNYGGGDSTIEFNGIMENYLVEKNKDQSYTISFEAKSHFENFNVYIRLFPSLKSNMVVNGASRFSIRYSGLAEKVADAENTDE
tara:strand:+ start:29900 stop:30460 length:561 start_codon:yes stop_codon:yes gene_type:complete